MSRNFLLDTPLLVTWEEIKTECTANEAKYLQIIRRWLRGKITLKEFEEECKKLVKAALHERFYNTICNTLEAKGHSGHQFKPVQILQNPLSRLQIHCISDQRKINVYFLLMASQHGLQQVDPGCDFIFFNHLRDHLLKIFDAVIRLARPFQITEAGYPHLFGATKMGNTLPIQTTHILKPEDILDALDLEPELIPHQFLATLFVKRLENKVNKRPLTLPASLHHKAPLQHGNQSTKKSEPGL